MSLEITVEKYLELQMDAIKANLRNGESITETAVNNGKTLVDKMLKRNDVKVINYKRTFNVAGDRGR